MIPLWWQILHKTFICHDSRGSIDCPQRLPFCSKNPRLFWGSRGPASLTASRSTRPQPLHPRKMPEYFPRVNYGDPQAKHARLPSFCWGGRRKKQQALRARRCSFWGGEGSVCWVWDGVQRWDDTDSWVTDSCSVNLESLAQYSRIYSHDEMISSRVISPHLILMIW